MLAALGVDSVDALLDAAVPESIRRRDALELPSGRTEREVLTEVRELAGRNRVVTSLIGMGYHGTITPPVIQRNLLENPAWYTAYTPYQPEISQGRLEALLNFQTMVADLAGMDLANASMLDEATAAAEAMTMCRRLAKTDSDTFVIDPDTHPQTIAVMRTRAEPVGIDLVVGRPDDVEDCFGALLSYPGSSGAVRSLVDFTDAVHALGGLTVVAADLLALVLLTPPGQRGADIVVGSAQRFGVPMGFGGPHAAFLATRDAYARSLPGRLVGVSTDSAGRPALRLALQTREQHIRREKATSNICTAQVLLANIAGVYAVWHGPEGLARIAERVHRLTSILAAGLLESGHELVNDSWFDTLQVRVPGRADEVLAAARERGINLRPVDADTVGLSLDETTTPEVVEAVWAAFGLEARRPHELDATAPDGLPPALAARTRSSPTPSSTATTASTSCCATSAGWPIGTWRWIGR